MNFHPDDVGIANGNIFGFPVNEQEAELFIIPVPWDVTASYGKGTSKAPSTILDASTQLDFYHPEVENAHMIKVFMSEISEEWRNINDQFTKQSVDYIQFLEHGGILKSNSFYSNFVNMVNEFSQGLCENLKYKTTELLQKGKKVAVLGGEHSVPLGLIHALNDFYPQFGILQIDAHADLRERYEGFLHSHASIMFNVLKDCQNVIQLTQVGVRDLSPSEVQMIKNNSSRIKTFFDWDLKREQFHGITWQQQVHNIIKTLPQKVYISFDIDGLSPNLCPNTGTPVPGGLTFEQATYLIFEIVKYRKEIIGFDLNEVGANATSNWDANVGARVLWNLVCASTLSK